MSLLWSAEKEMILAVESLALGGVPGSARPTTARTANPIPVAASNFLPFASATATFPPPLVVTAEIVAQSPDGAVRIPAPRFTGDPYVNGAARGRFSGHTPRTPRPLERLGGPRAALLRQLQD